MIPIFANGHFNLINLTFLKLVPSFTSGTLGKERFALISRDPAFRVYKSLIMINKSDVVLTGRNLLLGTLMPGRGKNTSLYVSDRLCVLVMCRGHLMLYGY